MVHYKKGKLVIEIPSFDPEMQHEDLLLAITFCIRGGLNGSDANQATTLSASVLLDLMEALLPHKKTIVFEEQKVDA